MREEFAMKFSEEFTTPGDMPVGGFIMHREHIADWWLSQFQQYKASLLRQIEEQKSSVEQLREKMGIAYEDLSVQVAYKEGYNASLEDIKNKII